MDRSFLVRLFGYRAAFIHGDSLQLDRWRWLREYLRPTRNGEKLLDVGCGTGSFTIGAAVMGYESVGLSWDERNQRVARERAEICNVPQTEFPIQDVRNLDQRTDFNEKFDVVLCFENIEHIMNDRKLMIDMARCMKPGALLYLTTPNHFYVAMSPGDNGPFEKVEQGWHVRRGYTDTMLRELAEHAGLKVEKITYCSGFLSQSLTTLTRFLYDMKLGLLAWAITLPLRILPILFDGILSRIWRWPGYSICGVFYKPRF